jgi:hypothetical protein
MPSRHGLGAYPIYPSHHDRLRRSFGRVYVGRAGPCSPEVGRVQAEGDGYLEAGASAGLYAKESRRALMNRQPTIAADEEAVGDLDAATAEDVVRAMAPTGGSARAGDTSACEQALADVEHSVELL